MPPTPTAGSAPAAGRRSGLPSRALLLSEPVRGIVTMAALPLAVPLLAAAPAGDGHGVLVLPGLMATDLSTAVLRRFLRSKGYLAQGWGLGRNTGPTPSISTGMPTALSRLAASTGGPVSLVGWSLGGIFARELARRRPDLVRQVITLASPFAMNLSSASHADGAFRRRSRGHVSSAKGRAELGRPIPVPSTSVYSRRDGIVAWRDCIEPTSATHENVEVRAGHLGVGADPAVLWLVADRLAQTADGWHPFRPPGVLRALFPEAR